jgi:energy-coupling factor transporter ATP-binding protein EcfA2
MKKKELVMDEARKLIRDPRFLYRAARKIGELGVVGELRNRLIIFLACLTMLLDEKVSVIAIGPSGSGKSTLFERTTPLYPPECVIKRASFSRKAIAYGEESLDGKILYVNEYRGGTEAQMMLRLLQSEGHFAHEYVKGEHTEVADRAGFPVIVTTTTKEDLVEDDSTRFLAVRVSEKPEHIRAVLKRSLVRRESQEPDVEVWQQAIRLLGDRAQGPFDFPRWLHYVVDQVPLEKVRVQRDWRRCLGMLQASALCGSQHSREISFADYCVVYQILNPALTATMHAVSEHELAVRRSVLNLSKELEHGVTVQQIREQLNWNRSMTYKYVHAAVQHKLIRYEGGTREKNVKRLLPIEGAAGKFLPSPRQVLQHVKDLGESVEFINPFNGELETFRR